MSETDIKAEWFTVLNDKVYFKSEVKKDLFGKVSGGGRLMVKELGPGVAKQMLNSSPKLRTVGGKLVSTEEAGLSEHDPLTGEVRSSRSVPTLNLQETWPGAGRLFYGDDAIYGAELGSRETELRIIRLPPDVSAEQLLTVSKGAAVSSVVIDQSEGLVVVGLAGPSPPWGFGIKKILLYQMQDGLVETLEIEGHIPLGELEAGGGLQPLVTP